MKTKLLYLTSLFLVFMTSCSSDENLDELHTDENKVVELFDMFSKNIVNSESYSKFLEEIQIKSSSGSTEEELNELEQEFLSGQSAEFIALYYYVLDLDLSKDELRYIVLRHFGKSSSKNGDCGAGQTSTTSLLEILTELVCEVINDKD
ncbi:hypothetical protein [uncultured Aquimarina sp.]|uniref:hypothetical protein n=1 Tax=uncultured Aquimarina sp. TaxID=575652 RepID=UPI00262DC023|nr:hypothetical protein [uncultured Aquimarina sp.]